MELYQTPFNWYQITYNNYCNNYYYYNYNYNYYYNNYFNNYYNNYFNNYYNNYYNYNSHINNNNYYNYNYYYNNYYNNNNNNNNNNYYYKGYSSTKVVLNNNGIKDITEEEYHLGTKYTTPRRLAWHVTGNPDDPIGVLLGKQFDELYVKLVSTKTAGLYPGVLDMLDKILDKNKNKIKQVNI